MAFESGHQIEASSERNVSAHELRQILHRIHADELGISERQEDEADDTVSIEAICELTGKSENQVLDLIEKVRREDREAELARRINELEEPLYRVERPNSGIYRDPLSWRLPAERTKLFSSILDNVPKPIRTSPKAKRQNQETRSEKAANTVGMIILIGFAIAFVLLMLRMVFPVIFTIGRSNR